MERGSIFTRLIPLLNICSFISIACFYSQVFIDIPRLLSTIDINKMYLYRFFFLLEDVPFIRSLCIEQSRARCESANILRMDSHFDLWSSGNLKKKCPVSLFLKFIPR